MKTIKILLTLVAFTATATVAFAQVTGSTTVSGTVVTPITTASTASDLGELIQEVTNTVATNATNAAKFVISGDAGKEVTVDFTFDAALSGTGVDIPVTYSGEFATTDAASGTANHAPSSTLTTALDATSGDLYFWVGTEVTPAVDQVAGAYSANLSIDVSYTGN